MLYRTYPTRKNGVLLEPPPFLGTYYLASAYLLTSRVIEVPVMIRD